MKKKKIHLRLGAIGEEGRVGGRGRGDECERDAEGVEGREEERKGWDENEENPEWEGNSEGEERVRW